MNHTFNINVAFTSGELVALFSKGISLLQSLSKDIKTMTTEMDDLTAQVTTNTAVIGSAIELINGIADRIDAAGGNKTKIAELVAELRAQDTALGAAVAANVVVTPDPGPPAPPDVVLP